MTSTWQPWEVVYEHIETKPLVQAHLVVDCVLVLITWIVVGLRITARKISGAGLGTDDFLILASLPGGFGMLVMQGMYSQLGIGYSLAVAEHNLPIILRILIAYVLVFAITTLIIKLSVLCFYLRIFTTPWMKRACIIVMVWVCAWSLGNILMPFLICRPFAASYDPGVTGTCGDQKAEFIAIGAFNALTDVAILALPVRTIWTLKTKVSTRISLLCVFLIGVITTVTSILRIISMNSLDLATNLTGTMIYADFLSAFEVNLGILCVSLPMLGPIYKRYISKSQGTTYAKSSGYMHGSSAGALRTFGQSTKSHYRLDDDANIDEADLVNRKPGTYISAAAAAANAYKIGGNGSSAAAERRDLEDMDDIELGRMQQQHIQVKTEWNVHVVPK